MVEFPLLDIASVACATLSRSPVVAAAALLHGAGIASLRTDMHELAITDAIVSGIHERVGEVRVRKVTLEIGALSAVLPDAVRFCFDVCAKGTVCEGAELEIVEPPARARCRACGEEFAPRDHAGACQCGAFGAELLSGQQLLVRSVEVE